MRNLLTTVAAVVAITLVSSSASHAAGETSVFAPQELQSPFEVGELSRFTTTFFGLPVFVQPTTTVVAPSTPAASASASAPSSLSTTARPPFRPRVRSPFRPPPRPTFP